MTSIRRGDIVRVLFPNSDFTSSKRRPALVVQADDLDTGLPQILVAMITGNMARSNRVSRVTVLLDSEDGGQSGLRLDSVIMLDNIVTIRVREIDSRLGSMTTLTEVNDALARTLGLTELSTNEYDN